MLVLVIIPCIQVSSVIGLPGHIYMASMTGAEHFVEHVADEATDLLTIAGLGPVKVVIIMRCNVFREARGSVTACPAIVHRACQQIVGKWLCDHGLQLPSMDNVVT